MKDRLGNDLNIGDLCVCYNNMGTGSSTNRLVQYEGEIVRFTPKQVKVKCVQCSYSEKIGREFICYPDNIFSIEPKQKGWISVKDRLPDDLTNVLCWYEYSVCGAYGDRVQSYGIGYCINGNWAGQIRDGSNINVIAWMPLPEPPEGQRR